MLVQSKMVVTNKEMKESKDHLKYAAVKIVSKDDGQNFDVCVKDQKLYDLLEQWHEYDLLLQITNGQYGIRMQINQVMSPGSALGA